MGKSSKWTNISISMWVFPKAGTFLLCCAWLILDFGGGLRWDRLAVPKCTMATLREMVRGWKVLYLLRRGSDRMWVMLACHVLNTKMAAANRCVPQNMVWHDVYNGFALPISRVSSFWFLLILPAFLLVVHFGWCDLHYSFLLTSSYFVLCIH